ncbi:SDR family oxidoreductase [Puteibacter caeruleilacunae]|nr:SDR family oxidoreductase [Puteibacter caeruleilacunae]
MQKEFEGKVALITGATGAIGKGVAIKLKNQGAKVFISDLKQEMVDEVCAELGCAGLAADVTNEGQVKQVVEKVTETYGAVDILVNVAGIIGTGAVEDLTEDVWDQMFAVNCKGSFFFTKYIVPQMKEKGAGKIINFSSKSGKTGSALMSHYCAAKGAIIAFTQALAYELASHNINVNCLCPGITDNTGVWNTCSAGYIKDMNLPREEVVDKFTAKIPLGRLASIEDVSSVTVFLASKGADYMTGQAINVTGGREMH